LIQGYEVVIGFETHAQLSTQSPRSSAAQPRPSALKPNTQACAVDLALPGTLPVMNKGAVERAIEFGLADWRSRCASKRFCAQKLFLPGPAQGLPDQPV
jgi:aspartyl-tRNA(Asn)/glutamyl-tRNA(Gln) amidotransferase subunit B